MSKYNLMIRAYLLLTFLLFAGQIFSQNDSLFGYSSLDTIETYTKITLIAGPNGFTVNDRKIDKRTYEVYKRAMDKADLCKPCWLKEYSIDGEFVAEGVYYSDCCVGIYYEYYPTGKLKTKGHYKENHTGDWKNIYKRGYCSTMHGMWFYYSESGILLKKETYKDGKLVD